MTSFVPSNNQNISRKKNLKSRGEKIRNYPLPWSFLFIYLVNSYSAHVSSSFFLPPSMQGTGYIIRQCYILLYFTYNHFPSFSIMHFLWFHNIPMLIEHINEWTKAQSLSHVWLLATSWTVAHQPPLSMGFSRQEDLSGLPFPPPGIKPTSLASPAVVGRFFTILPFMSGISLKLLNINV